MQYIAPIHKASSTLTAFLCSFTSSDAQDLVLNKGNRIEVHRLTTQGTTLTSEHTINGILTCLVPLHQHDSPTALLLCATTNANFFALTWSSESKSIQTVTSVNVTEYAAARMAEFGQHMLLDPQHQSWVALHAFHGWLRVAFLKEDKNLVKESKKRSGKRKAGHIEDTPADWVSIEPDFTSSFDVRLPDYQVHAMVGLNLSWEKLPVVAILHDNADGHRTLKLRPLSLTERDFIDDPPHAEAQSTVLDDPGSNLLLPLRDGVIVVGEQLAYCYQLFKPDAAGNGEPEEDTTAVNVPSSPPKSSAGSAAKGKGKRKSSSMTSDQPNKPRKLGRKSHEVYCRLPLDIYTASAPVPDRPDAFLLGSQTGSLLLLEIERDAASKITAVSYQELGHRVISAPTALVPLPEGRLFVASHSGDAQVFKLDLMPPGGNNARQSTPMEIDQNEETAEASSAHLRLIQRQTNLAPIVDFVVVENELGQSHMVACSGCNSDGSLRIISHGVGLTELASFDLEKVQKVWALKGSSGEDILALGFVDQTTLLRLPAGDIEEVEEIESMEGFDVSQATLEAFNLPTGEVVQVTRSGITSSNGQSLSAPAGVTVAAHYDNTVLLALEGAKMALVTITKGASFELAGTAETDNDVSCLALQRLSSGKIIAAAGLWSSQDIVVFDIPTFSKVCTVSAISSFVIRSILVSNLDATSTTLFAGLGDGSLLSFTVEAASGLLVESSKKSVPLGTRPITMSHYDFEDRTGVLVSSDQPTLITRTGGRTNYVPVNLKDINALCELSSNSWKNCLVLASPETVRIGRIDSVDNLQIRNILLGEDQPRRIAYSADARAYGLLCVRETFDESTGAEISSSSFKIVDESTFEVILDYDLQDEEQGASVAVLRTPEHAQELFAVGCSTLLAGQSLAQSGRVIIFAPSEDGGTFVPATEIEVLGTPFAIGALSNGLLAVTVNASLQLLGVSTPINSQPWTISEVDKWGGSFIATTLATRGDQMLVGDALRSVTLLKCIQGASGKTLLTEVGREHTSQGIMAVQFLDDEHFIAADLNLNLFTMSITSRAAPNSKSLQQEGLFHLGEIVTKLHPGSLVPKFSQSAAFSQSNLLYTTSSGSVGIINGLEGSLATAMSNLQRNMSRVAPALGSLEHANWRRFKTEYRTADSVGFVDGALVQTFADLDSAEVEAVLQGKNEAETLAEGRGELLDAVEELSRAHS